MPRRAPAQGAVRIAAMRGLRSLSGQLAERAAEPASDAPAEPRWQSEDVRRAATRVCVIREVAQ